MSDSSAGHSFRDAITGFTVGAVALGNTIGTPAAALAASLDTVDNVAQTSVIEGMPENFQEAAHAAVESADQADTTGREIAGLPEETSAEFRDADPAPGPEWWADADALAERGADDAAADFAPEAGTDAAPEGGIS